MRAISYGALLLNARRFQCLARPGFRTIPLRHVSSIATHVKPYYITTPIFYPNAVPHIGHLHSIVIADILARYARLSNPDRPVNFITGTDEHGFKIQKAASENGMEPLAFCDKLSQHFRNLATKAGITNTRFARTTEQHHVDAVQHLWRLLDAQGLIYKGSHEGWYSISDECFYTQAQVTRIEPSTNEEAYYVSSETGSKVDWMQEENYKFRLSAFRQSLLSHYTANPNAIYPSQHQKDIETALSMPLEDLSISRPNSRLSWGIPVPNDPAHTIYVWIDALTVYLSAAGYPWLSSTGSEQGWPPDVQVIGKDILRFHAIYLPAMLQALGLPLAKRLLAHSHWTVDQRKMSKSVGNVADPIEAIDQYGIDVVRYYLARVGGRFKDDVDWSQEQLDKHFREITSLLGNLYMRITSPKIMRRVSEHELPPAELLIGKLPSLNSLHDKVQDAMQDLQLAEALEEIVGVLQSANALMSETQPWSNSTSIESTLEVQAIILECLRICGIYLQPFMPSKAGRLLDALRIPPDERFMRFGKLGAGRVSRAIEPSVMLFEGHKSDRVNKHKA